MSLQYALPLAPSERQFLARIARGRGGPPRPAVWQAVRARTRLKYDAGPADAGKTDAAVAAALDVSAGRVGRWRRQATAEGLGAAALPAGRRGQSASPAAGPIRAAGRLCALDLAPAGPRVGRARDRTPDQLRNRAPHAEKTN